MYCSIYKFIYLSIHTFFYLSINQYISPSIIYISINLSLCLSICVYLDPDAAACCPQLVHPVRDQPRLLGDLVQTLLQVFK